MLILFFNYFLHALSGMELLISATIRDNKLYTISQDHNLDYVKLKVYKLKEGPIVDIFKSEKTYELIHNFKGFKLLFIDILDNSRGSHNRLWVRSELIQSINEQQNAFYRNWVGYIKLDDMTLIADSSIIKFPMHENFPINEYTSTRITNEFGSALYIIGGTLYSKNDDKYSTGNSFFKYNFTTKKWVDMAPLVNGKLKPTVGRKSVTIDNKYIVMLGGYNVNRIGEGQNISNNTYSSNYNSLYNLTVFDSFTNNLNSLDIEPSLFDTSVTAFSFDRFLTTVYNNKIIVLGGVVYKGGSDSGSSYSNLGILDYNSETWNWIPVNNDGSDKPLGDYFGQDLLTYNDQLIIVKNDVGFEGFVPIQVYDMVSNQLKSTLQLPDASSKDSDKFMSTYAAVLIANKTSSKTGKTKYNGPIREVWSNPDMDNGLNIIAPDKNNNSIRLNSNTGTSCKSNMIEFS